MRGRNLPKAGFSFLTKSECCPKSDGINCPSCFQLSFQEETFNLKCKTCSNELSRRLLTLHAGWIWHWDTDWTPCSLPVRHTLKQMMQSSCFSRGPFSQLAAQSKSCVFDFSSTFNTVQTLWVKKQAHRDADGRPKGVPDHGLSP